MMLISYLKFELFTILANLLRQASSQYHEPNICISKCVCLVNEGVIACHESDNIIALPTNIDKTVTRLVIQKGKFDFPTIFNYNLTGLEHLSFLKIVYCNLEVIAPRAFYRMKHLQYLDLSHNRLLKVLDYAFSGLFLTDLHLTENFNVQFEPLAFSSMQSSMINLRSNNMTSIDFDLFKNTKVRNLYLYNNSITRIDTRFQQLFNSTSTLLDVSNNPLICDCSLSWLAESLSMHMHIDKSFTTSKKTNIVCNKPDNLFGKKVMFLRPDDLNCLRLKINEIRINVSSESYQIACVSSVGGYKNPTVIWQHYINEYSNYVLTGVNTHEQIPEGNYRIISQTSNTVSIVSKLFRKGFIKLVCVASVDDNQIQSLEVKLNQLSPNTITALTNDSIIISEITKEVDYWFRKNFTLLEMISAIFGTFCATFVSLMIILRYLKTYQSKILNKHNEIERSKHSNVIKPYWYASNGHSSTYSVPNSNMEYDLPATIVPRTDNTIYSHIPNNRLEFLDYKTHNPIIK